MRKILPYIHLNGKIVHQKSARISIFDRGFLYGLGVFTTIKVREGIPLFLDRHLARLQISAKQLDILSPITYHLSPIRNAAYATIHKNNLRNGGLRITLTPSLFCIHAFAISSQEIPLPPLLKGAPKAGDLTIQQLNNSTIKVITLHDPRDIYKTIKTTYRLPHLLAQQQAQKKHCQDALFTQNMELIESTSANIFSCHSREGGNPERNSQFSILNSQLSIHTPPIKERGLNGITRQILMKNLPIQEQDIPAGTTNPLILVNSLSLRIVESINGKKINQNPQFATLIRQALEAAEKSYINNSCYAKLSFRA